MTKVQQLQHYHLLRHPQLELELPPLVIQLQQAYLLLNPNSLLSFLPFFSCVVQSSTLKVFQPFLAPLLIF